MVSTVSPRLSAQIKIVLNCGNEIPNSLSRDKLAYLMVGERKKPNDTDLKTAHRMIDDGVKDKSLIPVERSKIVQPSDRRIGSIPNRHKFESWAYGMPDDMMFTPPKETVRWSEFERRAVGAWLAHIEATSEDYPLVVGWIKSQGGDMEQLLALARVKNLLGCNEVPDDISESDLVVLMAGYRRPDDKARYDTMRRVVKEATGKSLVLKEMTWDVKLYYGRYAGENKAEWQELPDDEAKRLGASVGKIETRSKHVLTRQSVVAWLERIQASRGDYPLVAAWLATGGAAWPETINESMGDDEAMRVELDAAKAKIADLEQELAAAVKVKLDPRERTTLLLMVAALCQKAKIDPQGRGAATEIARLAEEFGVKLSDDAIRKALREIPNALNNRKE